MLAGRYSFVLEQGATKKFEIIYKDANGTPIDLSRYSSARMQIRETVDSATAIATLSSSLWPDGTGINFSGSNGTTPLISGSIGIEISAATSSLFTFETAVYDIELVSGSYVERLLQGSITLSKEVTR